MRDIINSIKKTIVENSNTDFSSPEAILGALKDKVNLDFYIAKKSRWPDDSNILRYSSKSVNLAIKIHRELFPLASHIYESPHLLKKVNQSNESIQVYETFVANYKNRDFRVVIFKFYEGLTLDKAFMTSNPQEKKMYKKLLLKNISRLLKYGFHPFIKDLSDFMLIRENKKQRVLLLDHNALFDCSASTQYSRKKVISLIDYIIDQITSKNSTKSTKMTKSYLRNL